MGGVVEGNALMQLHPHTHTPTHARAQCTLLTGATSSVSIMLILPGFLYYKLNPKPHPKRTFAVCFACFGILLGVVCLSSVIYSFIRGDS